MAQPTRILSKANAQIAKVRTSDATLNRIQDNLARGVDRVASSTIVCGVLLEGVTVAAGDNSIDHRLGRVPKGWIVVRMSAPVVVSDASAGSPDPSSLLVLTSTDAATLSLWVF